MRKTITLVCCILLLAVGAAPALAGQAGDIGLGFRVSYANLDSDNLNDGSLDRYSLDFAETASYGVNATYFFLDAFALELGLDWMEAGTEANYPGMAKEDYGDIRKMPVSLTGRFQPTVLGRLMPYLGVGISYSFNDVDPKNKNVDLDLENTLGYHLNAGVELKVFGRSAVNLDLKYIWDNAEIKEVHTHWRDTQDMNGWYVGFGYKYYF